MAEFVQGTSGAGVGVFSLGDSSFPKIIPLTFAKGKPISLRFVEYGVLTMCEK